MTFFRFLPLLLLINFTPIYVTQDQECVMEATFEDGSNNSGDPDINEDAPTEGRIFTSDEIARNSKYSLVHKLYVTDPDVAGSKRCESDNMKMMDARTKVGYEYFYGFSIYLPSTWEFDGDNADILVQWKGFGGQPFISLQQKHDGLYIRTNSNPDPDFNPENSDDLIKLQYPITKNVELGRWHDFIFRVIWDFKTDGVGLLYVDYKMEDSNEYKRVVDVAEPNMYNQDGYLKWGIYKPGWKAHPELTNVTMRMVWHDNIRIGFSSDMVDPDRLRE